MKQSIPQFTMQAIMEGSGLAIVGIISALALGTLRVPVLSLALVVAIAIIAVQQGYLANFVKIINRLPFVDVTQQRLRDFNESHRAMFTRQWLPRLLGLSIAIELVGAAIAFITVTDLEGKIDVFQAALVYIIPLLVGFLSFLPAGLGAAENSTIGVLLLAGNTTAIAVAATLVIRVSLTVLGVVYGLIALAISKAYVQK